MAEQRSTIRRRMTDEEVAEMMIPRIVEAIYPVLIPIEQQDMAIQAANRAKITAIARSAWRQFCFDPGRTNGHQNSEAK